MTTDRCVDIGYREGCAMPYLMDVWISGVESGQIMSMYGSAVYFTSVEDKRTKRIQYSIRFMAHGTAWISVSADVLTYDDGIFDDGKVVLDNDDVLMREYASKEE